MVYVFWAHLAVWVLVSFYIFMIQRKLIFMETRVGSIEERLGQEKEKEREDE
jgi:hypothetical protein